MQVPGCVEGSREQEGLARTAERRHGSKGEGLNEALGMSAPWVCSWQEAGLHLVDDHPFKRQAICDSGSALGLELDSVVRERAATILLRASPHNCG